MFDVVIIGGGFAGISSAYHLVKSKPSNSSIEIAIIEPNERLGGVAYSTDSLAQILNVPASKMGIDSEDPRSFVEFLTRSRKDIGADDFAPRGFYREYLEEVQLAVEHAPLVNLKRIQGRVEDIVVEGSCYTLALEDESLIAAKRVIIALGNSLDDRSSHQSLMSPWDSLDLERAKTADSVYLLGASLTAVDVVLDLERRGFTGNYNLISRRGLIPLAHASQRDLDQEQKEGLIGNLLKSPTILDYLRYFRLSVDGGADWRSLIDSLRELTPELWSNLPVKEKLRFYRHLRPYWDIHRHRIPAQSYQRLQDLISEGRLLLRRARVVSWKIVGEATRVSVIEKGSEEAIDALAVFNCLGLWGRITKTNSRLIKNLLVRGIVVPDDLEMGLRTSIDGELVDSSGHISHPGIYTIGSLRRGELLETTAVREIRDQAARIARLINSSL